MSESPNSSPLPVLQWLDRSCHSSNVKACCIIHRGNEKFIGVVFKNNLKALYSNDSPLSETLEKELYLATDVGGSIGKFIYSNFGKSLKIVADLELNELESDDVYSWR